MKYRSLAIAAVALATIGSIGLGGTGPATADEDQPGRIIWNQFAADFNSMHLASAAPDATNVRNVTQPPDGVFDQDPVFSPDGRWVVFNRYDYRQSDEGVETVGLVRATGGQVRLLNLGCVDPCVTNDVPSWTPDGKRLVFTRVVGPFLNDMATSAVLYTANLDGTDLRRLSQPGIDGTFEEAQARFAPGGRYLIFLRVRISHDDVAIFRMAPDGTQVRRLTPWALDADLHDLSPARSGPTKDLVAFETYGHKGAPPGETSRVATVPATCTSNADCASKIRYITPDVQPPNQAFNPAWSPDGRRIAYVDFRDQGPDQPALGIITTVHADGSTPHQVSDPAFFSFRPNWTGGDD